MAKIVKIAEGTYRPGSNNIGDVVAIHDDNVELGSAYDTFEIVNIEGVTAEEVREELQKTAINIMETNIDGRSIFQYEKDGKIFEVDKRPQYAFNLAELKQADVLNNSKDEKLIILNNTKSSNIELMEATEVVEERIG